jgi:FkbM family methyltransferase
MQVFAAIIAELQPKTVWDIGANSGTYGILTIALKPDCDVVFFEPIPKAVEIIHTNLSINDFDAKVLEIALGDFDGVGEIFFEKGHDFATSVTVNKNTLPKSTKSDSMKIQVRRLDSIVAELNLNPPNLVKLDVEKYEYEVLNGWGTQFPDEAIFLIEVLAEDLALKLAEFFPESRYHFWNIDDHNCTMRQVTKLEKSDFYNFLIVPKSLSNSIEKFLVIAR